MKRITVTPYEQHIAIVDSIGAENRSAGVRDIIERYDSVQTALRDCVRAHAVEQWTFIVEDDPTTLPEDSNADLGAGMLRYEAAWINRGGARLVAKSTFEDGFWYDWDTKDLADRGWRVYAWREWPEAPPRLLLTDEGKR